MVIVFNRQSTKDTKQIHSNDINEGIYIIYNHHQSKKKEPEKCSKSFLYKGKM